MAKTMYDRFDSITRAAKEMGIAWEMDHRGNGRAMIEWPDPNDPERLAASEISADGVRSWFGLDEASAENITATRPHHTATDDMGELELLQKLKAR